MTRQEAGKRLVELKDLVFLLSEKGFNPKNIPTYREILKDFEEINGLYPCEAGDECVGIMKKIIDLFPDQENMNV